MCLKLYFNRAVDTTMCIRLLIWLGVLGCILAQDDRIFELNIVHYNDFHAQ